MSGVYMCLCINGRRASISLHRWWTWPAPRTSEKQVDSMWTNYRTTTAVCTVMWTAIPRDSSKQLDSMWTNYRTTTAVCTVMWTAIPRGSSKELVAMSHMHSADVTSRLLLRVSCVVHVCDSGSDSPEVITRSLQCVHDPLKLWWM